MLSKEITYKIADKHMGNKKKINNNFTSNIQLEAAWKEHIKTSFQKCEKYRKALHQTISTHIQHILNYELLYIVYH